MRDHDLPRTDESNDALDAYVERASRMLAQGTSRRSFIRVMGTTILGLVGVTSTLPLLPIDRRTKPKDPACTYWKYCGMDGYPCANCGGSDTSCPSGSSAGTYWTGCCQNPVNNCSYYVAYYDCCGSGSCSTNWCNNSSQPSWCDGAGGSYVCTLASVSPNLCTSCPSSPQPML
jgi:methylamine dehydrogenase light chain